MVLAGIGEGQHIFLHFIDVNLNGHHTETSCCVLYCTPSCDLLTRYFLPAHCPDMQGHPWTGGSSVLNWPLYHQTCHLSSTFRKLAQRLCCFSPSEHQQSSFKSLCWNRTTSPRPWLASWCLFMCTALREANEVCKLGSWIYIVFFLSLLHYFCFEIDANAC